MHNERRTSDKLVNVRVVGVGDLEAVQAPRAQRTEEVQLQLHVGEAALVVFEEVLKQATANATVKGTVQCVGRHTGTGTTPLEPDNFKLDVFPTDISPPPIPPPPILLKLWPLIAVRADKTTSNYCMPVKSSKANKKHQLITAHVHV